MADPKHIEVLYKGAAAWNEWRTKRHYVRPDLRGAYLNGWNLAGINLQDADLRFAFLFRANLEGANLRLASLIGADLIQANLQGADLRQAALSGAYLAGTNLKQADLSSADLRGALMRRAILGTTRMPNGQMSGIQAFSAQPQKTPGQPIAISASRGNATPITISTLKPKPKQELALLQLRSP